MKTWAEYIRQVIYTMSQVIYTIHLLGQKMLQQQELTKTSILLQPRCIQGLCESQMDSPFPAAEAGNPTGGTRLVHKPWMFLNLSSPPVAHSMKSRGGALLCPN